MNSVGIKVLKNQLSEYLRRAERGERVCVTDRGRVIAQLIPPDNGIARDETVIERGIREGWIRAPTAKRMRPPQGDLPISFEQLMRDIEADREDR
jgi:prevent-host-death family protein